MEVNPPVPVLTTPRTGSVGSPRDEPAMDPRKRRGLTRMLSVGASMESLRIGGIYDHFLVVGLPFGKDTSDNESSVVYRYPPEPKPLPFEITPFATPRVLKRKKIEVQGTNFTSLSKIETLKRSYVFIITHDSTLFYVTAVINKELTERIPTFVRHFMDDKGPKVDYSKGEYTTTHRTYLVISKFPFFKAHFEFLYSCIGRERLYELEELSGIPIDPSAAQDEVVGLMRNYRTQIPPSKQTNQEVVFKLPNDVYDTTFRLIGANDEELVLSWSLPVLLRAVSIDGILNLLCAAMTECPIIIQSSQLGVLSNITMGMTVLIRPYSWNGPLIPFLPSSLHECLSVPVPYIVGVTELEEEVTEALILKIGEGGEETIIQPKIPLAKLFKDWDLLAKLKPLKQQLATLMPDRFYHPRKLTTQHLSVVKSIMDVFAEWQKLLLERYVTPNFRPGILHLLEKEKILANTKAKYKKFMEKFLDSQHLRAYVETQSKEQAENEAAELREAMEAETELKTLKERKEKVVKELEQLQVELRTLNSRISQLQNKQTQLLSPKKNLIQASTSELLHLHFAENPHK